MLHVPGLNEGMRATIKKFSVTRFGVSISHVRRNRVRLGSFLSISYAQLLKVFLNLFRKRDGFLIQVGQFNVDVAQGLLEIEIFVHFRRGNAHIARPA